MQGLGVIGFGVWGLGLMYTNLIPWFFFLWVPIVWLREQGFADKWKNLLVGHLIDDGSSSPLTK